MMLCGMEYRFGQFDLAVAAVVFPPILLPASRPVAGMAEGETALVLC